MELSTPKEIEAEPAESGSQQPALGTVEVLGGEMSVERAVEQFGEMLEQPEAFDLVPASKVRALEERVEELEEENQKVRRDLAVLWVTESVEAIDGSHVVPDGDGKGVGPLSVDGSDPTDEFDR